ncbi:F-box/kelch-repeat protein At3g18720-like [Rosa chinensis]|uniref:F-box/kelch-repeat protein At3g18720-like n=1 Tax=Rosa chinensis TaxID=74649 RepID=UPI000D097C78|nr:F-box/kelch-repeat protein At3g18720-like [Rosa chinensis]
MTGLFGNRFFTRILKKATFYAIKGGRRSPEKQKEIRDWSDLPPELLSLIAERAGLFALQSFHRVCKAWNSASSAVLPQILETELNQGPWFLLYDDKSPKCKVLTGSGKKLIMSRPELDRTTCLATYQGWLLLFQQGCGSMFFFHLFSRRRIDLPQFPDSELTDHVAAVSCSPTSQDCMVCVISRSNDAELEAKVLYLGEDQAWTKLKYSRSRVDTGTIKFAVYHTGMFCFFDHRNDRILTLSTEIRAHNWSVINLIFTPKNELRPGTILFDRGELKEKFDDMKKKLGLTKGVSISTCGTITLSEGLPKFIFNESISDHAEESKRNHFKGVTIIASVYNLLCQLVNNIVL